MSVEDPLPTWAEQMRALEDVGSNLLTKWRPEGATETEAQDMNKLALSILASGYLCSVYTDAHRPVFMPMWNYAFNQGGPNPDFVYSSTEIDAAGVYRISGYRGTSRFVEITQQGFERFSPAVLSGGEKRINLTYDLDDLTLDDDGAFNVLLSAEPISGYDGDWWRLDPAARRLLMRRCACDWTSEVDARVAIDRIDDGGADMTPEESARRFSALASWIEGMIEFDMQLVRYYREHHGLNTLMRSKLADASGLPGQVIFDGIHEIDDDECLIIVAELPESCRYWQANVADDRFSTVDWVNRQSSLNDTQAHMDADGRFRAVISRLDPGVPNWLDKADTSWGMIQLRMNRANRYPDPTITKVRFADLREHLPADTPIVTPQQRAEQLRRRRQGAQLRRIW